MILKQLKHKFLSNKLSRSFSSKLGFYTSLQLTPEQQDLRLAIQKFASEEVQPLADQIDRSDKFPRHLWPKLGDLGLLGITAPTQYGGTELSYFQHCLAMQQISKASGSVGLSYGAHSNLMVNQLVLNGSEEQKKKYLPKLCSGQYVGALAMSEVGAGSDVVGSMKTNAKYDANKKKWIMNGGKMWITNASQADLLIIYARTPKSEGDRAMTAFLVQKDMKGFSIAQKLDKLGMRGSPTCQLVLDNIQIPQENILGGVGQGVYVLMSGLNSERLVLSAGPIGIMQACMDLTMNYITQREQFGKKVGEFQLMQGKVADMYVKLQTTRNLVYNLARQASEGAEKLGNKECAAAILYSAQSGTQMALQTIQALGGNGYTNEYPSGRYLRDAKLYEIGAGTSQIRRLIIGRELFKQFS